MHIPAIFVRLAQAIIDQDRHTIQALSGHGNLRVSKASAVAADAVSEIRQSQYSPTAP